MFIVNFWPGDDFRAAGRAQAPRARAWVLKRSAAPRRGRRPPPTPTASCRTSPGSSATAPRWSCPRAPRCSLSCNEIKHDNYGAYARVRFFQPGLPLSMLAHGPLVFRVPITKGRSFIMTPPLAFARGECGPHPQVPYRCLQMLGAHPLVFRVPITFHLVWSSPFWSPFCPFCAAAPMGCGNTKQVEPPHVRHSWS